MDFNPFNTDLFELEKLSMIMGSKSASIKDTAVWEPIYPAPPVIKIFFIKYPVKP
jgi:hypothetical protein